MTLQATSLSVFQLCSMYFADDIYSNLLVAEVFTLIFIYSEIFQKYCIILTDNSERHRDLE